MSRTLPELLPGDVSASPRRSARRQRLDRLSVILTAFSIALLSATAPHAFAARHKDLRSDRLYVANGGSGTVSVIDTRTNAIVGSPIHVGKGPAGVAVDRVRGRAYVTNSLSDTVSVIDTRTNKVVGSPIHVGKGPAGVAVDRVRGRAYVTNSLSD
ncbi:YncE family protein, partial [Streptomyces sp. NPDC055134]